MNSILDMPISSDSELTARAAAGQRDAFAQIVSRYQSLVCSLAYSATGSITQSEDLAQETFIAAWKGLTTMRQPEKLRSWLCGIARNIIASAARIRKQEPANTAEAIEAATDLPSPESLPVLRGGLNQGIGGRIHHGNCRSERLPLQRPHTISDFFKIAAFFVLPFRSRSSL